MGRAWKVTISVGCAAALTAAVVGDAAQAGVRGLAALFLVAATVYRLRRDGEVSRAPWMLIAAGGVLALVSALTRLIHGFAIDETNPFPSIAELPGFVGYTFVIAAARSFWTHRSERKDTESALDGLLVAAAAAVVVFSAILSDYIRDSAIDPWARTGNVVYTVLTITLVGHVARLAIGPGIRNGSWRLIATATCLILTNDLLLLLDTTGSEWAFTLAGVTSGTAFAAAAAAILHPAAAELTRATPYRSPKLTMGRLAMLAAALLTLPAALLAALVRDTAPDLPVLVTDSAVLALLSLMRISLLFRAKERIGSLDTALTQSGRELLDASTATEIAVAVSRTIRLVVDEDARYAAIVRGAKTNHLVVRAIPEETAEIEPMPIDTPDPDLHDLLCVAADNPELIELDLGEKAQFGADPCRTPAPTGRCPSPRATDDVGPDHPGARLPPAGGSPLRPPRRTTAHGPRGAVC